MSDEINEPHEGEEEVVNEAKETLDRQARLARFEGYLNHLRMQQSLSMGFLGGLAAAFAGAILWAIVTVATGYQIGYMAVGVGLMVGFAIRYAGKGIDPLFGYMGAGLSLFGCLLGNFFTLVGFASKEAGSGIFETFSLIDYGLVPGVMAESFGIMTLLFFGIALYEGYKFSIQKVTDEGFAAYLKAI